MSMERGAGGGGEELGETRRAARLRTGARGIGEGDGEVLAAGRALQAPLYHGFARSGGARVRL